MYVYIIYMHTYTNACKLEHIIDDVCPNEPQHTLTHSHILSLSMQTQTWKFKSVYTPASNTASERQINEQKMEKNELMFEMCIKKKTHLISSDIEE